MLVRGPLVAVHGNALADFVALQIQQFAEGFHNELLEVDVYKRQQSIWDNGEPGVHNNDVINLWNPVKSIGTITTSNPCSEYVFLNNTSCNLSSFNACLLYTSRCV